MENKLNYEMSNGTEVLIKLSEGDDEGLILKVFAKKNSSKYNLYHTMNLYPDSECTKSHQDNLEETLKYLR